MTARALSFFLLTALLFTHNLVNADVHISKIKSISTVTSNSYEIKFDAKGNVRSLMARGESILTSTHNFRSGAYFYAKPKPTNASITQGNNSLTIKTTDNKEAKFSFEDDKIIIHLKNTDKSAVTYFLILSSDLFAVRNLEGKYQATPANIAHCEFVFFSDRNKISISGVTKIWGPWGDHHVVAVTLKKSESRDVSLSFSTPTIEEKRELAPFRPVGNNVSENVILTSPSEYQVVQRQKNNKARVKFSGELLSEVSELNYRVITSEQKESHTWQSIQCKSGETTFTHELDLEAGGWYRFELRTDRHKGDAAEVFVERFGVGEVFVGAGQSNSTNSGEKQTTTQTGMVGSFDGKKWRLANDPQKGCHDSSGKGSFWPSFGDEMNKKFKVPIGICVTGHGGTSVNAWQPDEELFAWMMTRINTLGKNGFRAVLWHQGESDIKKTSEEYETKLTNVIQSSKKEAGWKFPWFIAIASYHNPSNTHYENIRSAQLAIVKKGIALQGPDTDELGGDYRDKGGKGIHFSEKGLLKHGQLWAEKVSEYLSKVLKNQK